MIVKKRNNSKYKSSGKSWSKNEKDLVVSLKKQGYKIIDIVKEINTRFKNKRTEFSVIHALKILKVEPKRKIWSSEEVDFILDLNSKGHSLDSIVKSVNEKYNNNRTFKTLQNKLIDLGIRRKFWSDEEDKVLQKLINTNRDTSEIVKELNKRFQKNRTRNAVVDRIHTLGIKRLTPFHKHDLITLKNVCEDFSISILIFYKIVKKYEIKTIKQGKYIFLNIDEYDKFSEAIKTEDNVKKNIMKDYLSIKDSAKFLNIDYELMRSWVRRKNFTDIVRHDKSIYLNKEKLNELKVFLKEFISIGKLAKEIYYSNNTIKEWLKNNTWIKTKIFLNEIHIDKEDIKIFLNKRKIEQNGINQNKVWSNEDLLWLKDIVDTGIGYKKVIKVVREKQPNRFYKDIVYQISQLKKVFWADEEVNILKQTFQEAKSQEEFIRKYNEQIVSKNIPEKTRKAIITKCYRLGLELSKFNKKWTSEEIFNLKNIFPKCKNFNELIKKYNLNKKDEHPKRQEDSLRRQLKKLGYGNYFSQKWTVDEINLLKKLIEKNYPVKKIFTEFNSCKNIIKKERTISAIEGKIKEIKI